MSGRQAEQPTRLEEGILPTRLIGAAGPGDPAPPLLFAQQAPQSPAYPAVDPGQTAAMMCLKYSNQPRSVRLRSVITIARLSPRVRLVFARTVSFSLVRRLARVTLRPATK